jgi:hypothetical protein
VQQLLWIETLLKLSAGAALALAPLTVIKLAGLPPASSGFWPRLFGGVLLGLGAAAFIEGASPGAGGLGLAGAAVVNLLAAAVVAILAGLGAAAATRRGTAVLWTLVGVLVVLSLFEIAGA